jgi:hypothetical protein
MKDWIDLIRAAVRPFIIVWGLVVYGICIINGTEVPALLGGLVAAVIMEYFGERAALRLGGR